MNLILILIGKLLSKISQLLNFGHGSTWPGHIALKLNKNFIVNIFNGSEVDIILVTGTNGKTTTAKLLQTILEKSNKKVFVNYSGANLLNGIASVIIQKSNLIGKLNYDFAIFEIDENTLPQIVNQLNPKFIIALNLFRDQLDRYGEVNTISKNWADAYKKLKETNFILNADDPQVASLGFNLLNNVYYFGINDEKYQTSIKQHASDSIICPRCSSKLNFEVNYFSHLGIWRCKNCGLARPKLNLDDFNYYPLKGTYAVYDTLAAVLTAQAIGVTNQTIENALKSFVPAFGRQEITVVKDRNVQLFLSKNPTSFNESLKTINQSNPKNLFFVLNDRIPDGTDISWIWDVDFETLLNNDIKLYLAGDRVYDLALRIKYSDKKADFEVFENLREGIDKALKVTKKGETLFILPTYSAMLDIRKILTGKKIL